MRSRFQKLILVASTGLAVTAASTVPEVGTSAQAVASLEAREAERPTKAAFISRADAICRRADDKEAPLIYRSGSDPAGAGASLVVVLRAKHRALRQLVPPAGFDRGWSRLLGQIEANIDRFARNVARAKAGKAAREDTSTPLGRLTDSMRAYGFKWCP